MGSLAFALGGGLAGAGKGIAEVGQEITQANIQQKLMEMRQNYEASLQTRGFQHQEQMVRGEHEFQLAGAKAGREFQVGQQHEKLASEETRATKHEAAATERANILARSRVAAAGVRANAAGNKPVKPSSEWTPKNIPFPDAMDPTHSHTATIMSHKSGLQLTQMKDGRWVPFTGDVANTPDPTSVARAPVADVQLLLRHPEQSQQFLAHWKYLPSEWQAAEAQRFSARQSEYESHGRPIDQPATGGSDEAAESAEDEKAAEGGADDDLYDQRPGGAPPQASDTQPAQ